MPRVYPLGGKITRMGCSLFVLVSKALPQDKSLGLISINFCFNSSKFILSPEFSKAIVTIFSIINSKSARVNSESFSYSKLYVLSKK